MSKELLESLRAGGDRVSGGGFTLDRDKARDKLAKFQLADPHHYVLQFVQAAHILEATYIDIELDTTEMRMHFDGIKFRRAELENLYRASFSQGESPTLKALRHVAIGVMAAWALEPSSFLIDVDDGESKLKLMLDRDGDDAIAVEPSGGTARTAIYLQERLRPSHLLEFFRQFQGVLAEEVALREFCAHSRVPILLNRSSISRGHRLDDRARGVVEIDTPREAGRLGLTLDTGLVPTRIKVLKNGVLMTEVQGSEEPFGFDAIVDSTRIRTGLSQGHILRDEAWEALRHEVVSETVYRSLAKYLSNLDDIDAATRATKLRQIAAWLWSPPNEDMPGSVVAARRDARRAIREVSIWRYAHRPEHESTRTEGTPLVSLADLASDATSAIAVSSAELKASSAVELPRIIHVEPAQYRVFEEVFGSRVRDMTARVMEQNQRVSRLLELERRGRPSPPDPDYFRAYRARQVGPFRAFVGLRSANADDARSYVEWTNDDLILHQRRIDVAFANLYIWFQGPLSFTLEQPYFEVSPAYIDAASAALTAVPEVAADVIEQLPAYAAFRWLHALTNLDVVRSLAYSLEVPGEQMPALMHQFREQSGPGRWHDLAGESAPDGHAEIEARIRSLGPLADIDAVEIGLERRVSLRELLEIYRESGRLLRGHRVFPQLSGADAVTGGDEEVEFVERFFGGLSDPQAQGEHQIYEVLHTMHKGGASAGSSGPSHGGKRAPIELEPPAEISARQSVKRVETPSIRSPKSTSESVVDGPAFMTSIRRAFAEGSTKPVDVELKQRAGSPAALIEGSTCVVNSAHPIISDAIEHPDSGASQHWAETAILVALAAGGSVREREFAYEGILDLLDAP